jgi:hypothetical protein
VFSLYIFARIVVPREFQIVLRKVLDASARSTSLQDALFALYSCLCVLISCLELVVTVEMMCD